MVSNHPKHFMNTLDTSLNVTFVPVEYGMQGLEQN